MAPNLSIIVISHNMRREAPRTLFGLSDRYQRNVSAYSVEVIVVDNGSREPLDPDAVRVLGGNFSHHFLDTASRSPAAAVNFGLRHARGEYVAVIVDGARLPTPGLVDTSLRALRTADEPFVVALAWHLGPDVQNVSIANGYDQAEEDRLLDSIGWTTDGYRLFEIATLAQSSSAGLLGGLPEECSWFAARRKFVAELGGFDERFQAPGGGLVNHDFFRRALDVPGVAPIVLLGEGTFHQIHGGVATNVSLDVHPFKDFADEYRRIRGEPLPPLPPLEPNYFGPMTPAARAFIGPAAKGAAAS